MSSQLPAAVLADFDARWRLSDGRYRCAHCRKKFGKTAIHRDHVKPEATHPELRFDPANLQPLCIPCHKAKTRRDAARRRPANRASLVGVAVGIALVWAAVYTLGWVVHAYTGALPDWTSWHLLAAKAAAAGFAVALVARTWWNAGAGEEIKTLARDHAAEEQARIQQRIVAEAREVFGPRGEVKVERMEWR